MSEANNRALELLQEFYEKFSENVDLIDETDREMYAMYRRWRLKVAMFLDVEKLHEILRK